MVAGNLTNTISRSSDPAPRRATEVDNGGTSKHSPANPKARKTPHCSKCERPKAGHPRTGCPFSDSPPREASTSRASGCQEIPPGDILVALNALSVSVPQREDTSRPKAQDKQQEIRSLTLRLAKNSAATVHILAREVAHEIAQEAKELGLCAEIALEEVGQVFLVVGKDEVKVKAVLRRMTFASQEVTELASHKDSDEMSAPSPGGPSMRAVAGGMVAGAVGAWAGLAFT